MPNIPSTATPNLILTSVGDGQNSSKWAAGNSGTIVIARSYAILGPIANYTFPRFTMAVPDGQTVILVAVVAVLSAGTITVDAKQNGSGIAGLTSISVSTTSTGYVTPTDTTSVADLDYFQIVTSATSSTGNLTVDFVFAITP